MATVTNETHIVTIGNERHLRYVLLVGQGGTITLREILIRDLGPDFQKSIKEKKTNLKIERKEIERIFNSDDNDISDIKTWDISLLSKLILQLCREITPTDELKSVRDITRLRNQISHTSEFVMDEDRYFDECNDVAGILMNLCKGLDNSTKAMCQNLIKNCKKGQIEKQAALEVLAEIRKYDRIIVDQLESLRGKVEEILTDGGLDEEKVNIIQTGIEELKQTIMEYIRAGNAECHSFVALESRLTFRGSDIQLTSRAEETLIRVFRTANNRTKGENDVSELTIEVRMLLDEIEGFEGVTFCGAERECVIMKLKCDNYKGLLELLDYFQCDEFRKRLGTLAKLLEEANRSHYQITFEIDPENVRSIKNTLETPTSIGSDCDDQEFHVSKAESSSLVYKNPIDIENATLFDEIVELLKVLDRDPEVIMLIGQSGAGKSAMINTIYRVLTREKFIVAKYGSGKAQTITVDLQRYDNCGVDLNSIRNDSRRQKIEAILPKLPHIVDCAGLGDDDSPELREILELLVGGFITKGTTIEYLQSKQEEFGVGCLHKIFDTANSADKVTKVIFMQSCRNAIPGNLIKCLKGVLQMTDPTTGKRKYTAELFLLITKYDLVQDSSVRISTGHDKDSMTLKAFVEKENELAPELDMIGSLDDYRIRWASYTGTMRGDNGYIENIALSFLKRMVEPGAPPAEPGKTVVGWMKTLNLYKFKLSQQIRRLFLQDMPLNLSSSLLVTAMVFIVVMAVVYKLLTADLRIL